MLRRFTDGLVFGAGFGIAFTVLQYVVAYVATPSFVEEQFSQAVEQNNAPKDLTPQALLAGEEFRELAWEEQVQAASVIAIAQYEEGPDGSFRAVISEVLKRTPGTEFYYKVGDEYHQGKFFPRDGVSHGDGLVIYFVGSPARSVLSSSIHGDRILGLGDMPLELFRKKCCAMIPNITMESDA